jgi:YD repeat-containing protein
MSPSQLRFMRSGLLLFTMLALMPALCFTGSTPTVSLTCDTQQLLLAGTRSGMPVTFTVKLNGVWANAGEPATVDLVRAREFFVNTEGGDKPKDTGLPDYMEMSPFFTMAFDSGTYKYIGSTTSNELNYSSTYDAENGVIPGIVGTYAFVARVYYRESSSSPVKVRYSKRVYISVTNAPVPYQESAAPMVGPLNLATGEEQRGEATGLTVENPLGPTVDFSLSYASAQARVGYASTGLWPGWVHNYDLQISSLNDGEQPQECGLKVTYPNGASDICAVNGGTIIPPHGAPYVMAGSTITVDHVDYWDTLTMTRADRSRLVFSHDPGGYDRWRLTSIMDSIGRAITVNWGDGTGGIPTGCLASVADCNGKVLMQCSYDGAYLNSVTDSSSYTTTGDRAAYGRTVGYKRYDTGTKVPELEECTYPYKAGEESVVKYAYDYDSFEGPPAYYMLNKVTSYDNGTTGTGGFTSIVRTDGGLVEAHYDQTTCTLWSYTLSDGPDEHGEYSCTVTAEVPTGSPELPWRIYYFNNRGYCTGTEEQGYHRTTIAYEDARFPWLPTKVTGLDGCETTSQYDDHGNTIAVTSPDGITTQYVYDDECPDAPLGLLTDVYSEQVDHSHDTATLRSGVSWITQATSSLKNASRRSIPTPKNPR